MVIGLLEFTLHMTGTRSLKEKRMVLTSLKARVHNRFNVSIAEVGMHDRWGAAQLAAVTVASDGEHAHRALEAVARYVEGRGDASLAEYRIQML